MISTPRGDRPDHPDPSDRATGLDARRFVAAQDADRTFERAMAELRAGSKRTHWMWFVFPQLAGLGSSPTAVRYAIETLDAARAYLDHPVLGARLRAAAELVADAPAESAQALLGGIDSVKLRSSMTLFAAAADAADAPDDVAVFRRVLDRWYDGRADPVTVELLGAGPA
ncbi:DUF1810 domain-containing protein [Nakamurella leprariae]|uniref:DUF1810 domain-containing protein n=1 Tax=Nakamurella leprariae TaxID=2803911 RepID=A0A938YJR3_9ACTN|nr:DUF1810 domain-containing protein [Nakamurella leprariae]MBM9469424.1 DUF1810 domain-containing protein [Nakamurella leprariae]